MLHAHHPCFSCHSVCMLQVASSCLLCMLQTLPLGTSSHWALVILHTTAATAPMAAHSKMAKDTKQAKPMKTMKLAMKTMKAMKAIKARKAMKAPKAKPMKAAKPEVPVGPQPPLWWMAIHCMAPKCPSWVWVTRLSQHACCKVCAKPWAESISNIKLHM